MTAPESHLLHLLFSLGLVVPSSYVAGRVHQWYTHSLRRDVAFRQGYDHASHAMFDLAMQHRVVTRPGETAADVSSDVAEMHGHRAVALTRRRHASSQPTTSSCDASGRQPVEIPRTRSMPRAQTGRRGLRRESFPE